MFLFMGISWTSPQVAHYPTPLALGQDQLSTAEAAQAE